MLEKILSAWVSPAAAALCAALPSALAAQDQAGLEQLSYADLVDLSDPAESVIRARIRKQAELEPERAPGVRPGYTRLYLEAETVSLITGRSAIGESLRYLVDVPLDQRGKAPKLKKREVLVFTRRSNGRPGEIALVGPHAQLFWTPELEARLRPVLAELAASDAPPAVTGVREALAVEGNLAGESETQLFLDTESGSPVSVTVVRRPGMRPIWGVSWSEIVDQAARPPQRETLAWYRLACFLPGQLPGGANLSSEPRSQARAADDYRFVIEQLGPCPRNRE